MARVAKTTTKDIESFEHREARRKNIPTAELETLVSEGRAGAEDLRNLIGIDTEKANAFARLTEKICRDEAALAKLDRDIEIASHADERRTAATNALDHQADTAKVQE
jgi:hypothetical protein